MAAIAREQNDVFVLGAGFSRAISAEMPLLADLTEEIQANLSVPPAALALGGNLELWLSYLAQPQPWLSESENLRNRAIALDISREVARLVEGRSRKARESPHPEWLRKLVWYWHERRAHVISLNYDVLVERAAWEIQEKPASSERISCSQLYPVSLMPAGARAGAVLSAGPRDTFKLYKLHGSTNWFYSGRSSFFGEAIVYAPVTSWLVDSRLQKAEDDSLRHTSDKAPLIIPPLFDKVLYFEHESIRSLWAQAGVAVQEATRIYWLGYSLPQTDMALHMLFKTNARKQHVPLFVVNTDRHAPSHYSEVFKGNMFEIEDQFACEDALPRLVEAL